MTTARQTRKTAKKEAWRDSFLAALAAVGNVSEAAKAAGVSRAFVYTERKADPAFAALWDDALDGAADVMEREAFRRAVEGVDEPVFQQGQEIGTIRKYSDTLLIFLLKGARPNKYRERQDVTQSGAVTIKVVYDDADSHAA